MLDLLTLWLTLPEDRYEASAPTREAERRLYRLLVTRGAVPAADARPPRVTREVNLR